VSAPAPEPANDSLPKQTEQQNTKPPQSPPPSSTGARFLQNYLGFIVIGVIILFILRLIMLEALQFGRFLSIQNLTNMLNTFFTMGIVALGTVAATRLRGPDLSLGAVMSLTGIIVAIFVNEGFFNGPVTLTVGILLAIIVCFFVGLLNGVFISLLNTPAIVTTLVTAILLRGITPLFSDGIPMNLPLTGFLSNSPFLVGLAALMLSVIFAYIALSAARRLPVLRRRENTINQKLADLIGYGFVAVIACIGGLVLLFRIQYTGPAIGSGYEINIFIIFAAIQSSNLLKNNYTAMGYGLFVALMLIVTQNLLSLLGVSVSFQLIIQAIMALLLLSAAGVARGKWASNYNSSLRV